MKNFVNNILLIIILFFNVISSNCSIVTALNNNDPILLFSTNFPYEYLYTCEKEYLKKRISNCESKDISFTISPFYQHASRGKDLSKNRAELGDLTGKWNMIALLPFNTYQDPENPTPNSILDVLEDLPYQGGFADVNNTEVNGLRHIRNDMLSCILTLTNGGCNQDKDAPPSCIPPELTTVQGLLKLQDQTDLLGFYSVKIKYKKRGVRFSTSMRFCDFGFSFQTGVAEISQTATFINEMDPCEKPSPCTCPTPETNTIPPSKGTNCDAAQSATCATGTPAVECLNPFPEEVFSQRNWVKAMRCINRNLMDNLNNVADLTGVDLCNFSKTGIEDLHAEIFWRHAFDVTRDKQGLCVTPFLFIPFATVGFSFATGAKKHPDKLLSLPFGNNGHHAVRVDAGFSLDFFDTIEIGAHGGFTRFSDKNFSKYRVPNNDWQNGIYPFTTSVNIKPGNNYHIGVFMNSIHFIECMNFYMEYLYVTHIKDRIHLCQETLNGVGIQPFNTENLECKSQWTSQVINASLNYELSPNFLGGFLVQIPIERKNAYKSTMYMLSLEMAF